MSSDLLCTYLKVSAYFEPIPVHVDFVCSSDGWKKHAMIYDQEQKKWVIQFDYYPRGKHQCKFCIDGYLWKCLDNLPKAYDSSGNENNEIEV
ncbi:uncharacterized protein MONOS_5230 [Monocercomonoides exilis]|uniref:uncharacterized protein n=1 Tax=Monocercomonoides exilis TaxID=2049356 RepID=UPI00355A5C2F|nr:hypothetical protein MONOS_5230 [Monocercomonoides exilis]|eukprot:MONOS_5230.1-p1 / transcript=MONOS_5230.1 / gene=MONOS_5230 / organism=Monocercomonoides_exilis_PA203 / gene_product=unspecified product / transcript_product=unspecified product / location=Mono_scaffold00150:3365-3740(+) / protein_length=92 / sequence_SO=supercontig / SO=protein_coding / is_pseudo=false